MTFDGNAVSLDGLKAKFGDGDVKFSGNIALKSFMPDQFNLSAVGTAMRLRYPEGFSSTVNADLSLTGPVAAPLLSGRVDVLYAAYTQTIDTDAGIVMFAAGAAGAGRAGQSRKAASRRFRRAAIRSRSTSRFARTTRCTSTTGRPRR